MDPVQILDLKESHLAVLDDHNKRIKEQKEINLKENMARRDQDMVEVQNWSGPRNPDEVVLTFTQQLLVVKKLEGQTRYLTDAMLDDDECTFSSLSTSSMVQRLAH